MGLPLAAVAAAMFCGEPEPRGAIAPPAVLFTGCQVVLAGDVCATRPGATLVVWAEAPGDARLVLEWDGEEREASWKRVGDGQRTTFVAREVPGTLSVRDAELGWRWTLTLQAEPERSAALREFDALFQSGRNEEAGAALAAALPTLTGAALAEGLLARAKLEYVREDMTAALTAFESAFESALAEGLLLNANLSALMASWICAERTQDLACARRWLERQAELVSVLPEARLHQSYNVGLLAAQEGDLRMASRSLSRYVDDARAFGSTRDLAAGLLKLGALVGHVGEHERAQAMYRELLTLEGLPEIDRARALQSEGWLLHEARVRGETAEDPVPRFVAALATFEAEKARPDAAVVAEIRINLALAHIEAGAPSAARTALAPLRPTSRRLERWAQLASGRIALAEGDFAGALRELDAVAAASATAGDHRLEWEASALAGEALERLGEVSQALERYRRAAALHTSRVRALAMFDGREHFAAGGDGSARRLVRLLVRLGRAGEAACAARRARAQAFAGAALAARGGPALADLRRRREALAADLEATWQRPWGVGELERARLRARRSRLDAELDDLLGALEREDMSEGTSTSDCAGLRPPGPGTLLLVYFPIEGGLMGFAIDDAGVRAAELGGEPGLLAGELLAPFSPEIERAGRIEVVVSGPASAVNFHALPWRGRPLVEHAAVAYRLDLERAPVVATPRTAVQLAPRGSNLPGATDELEAGGRALQDRGVTVVRLLGDEAELGARLGVDLLHFVGHAHADGWASALDLGGERRLTASDLLAGSAPRVAVLAGCETGLPDPRAHAGGISLAHALLLSGSSAVIATDARVQDRLAAELTPSVLASLADGVEPAEALRRAQLARLDRGDWARFRAFVP